MGRGPNHRRTATLASLAAELGVSRTTVSNAYNRPDQLSAELRQRVLEAARRLGYPGPDPVARSLRTKQAGAVGLLFTERLGYAFRDPAAVAFLEGLASACEQHGSGLVLVPGSQDREDRDGSLAIRRASVDAFVIYSMPDGDPGVTAVLERNLPTVVVDSPAGLGEAGYVGINDSSACAAIATHVVGLGHRRMGVVTTRLARDGYDGPASIQRQRATSYRLAAARLAGFAQGLTSSGVDWTKVPVEERQEHSVEAGAAAAAALLDRHPDLTAIMCMSDVYARGVVEHAAAKGIRVPEDLSVTGFDDTPEASIIGLTTMNQPMMDKGQVAGRMILGDSEPSTRTRRSGRRSPVDHAFRSAVDSEDDEQGPRRVLLPAELVIRTSTGPPG